jgi:hypothetical protein
MVASLKLMQSSKANSVKTVEVLLKIKSYVEGLDGKDKGKAKAPDSLFGELDKLLQNGP